MERQEEPRTAIADQAIDWLVRLDAGHGDTDAFEAWRHADPRHAAAFAQVATLWQRTGELRGSGVEISQTTSAPPEANFPAANPHRRKFLAGMAASLTIAVVGGGYLLSGRRAYASTGVGERRVLQLPGGSRVELNTDTRVAWRFGERLDLWLEHGEAGIVAMSGTDRDFIARTGNLTAQLQNGRFNLSLSSNRTRLIALSGEALVMPLSGGKDLLLRPGQALDATDGNVAQMAMNTAQIEAATAWQRGEIVFDGMTLASALGQFNRYLPRPIELGDPALGAVRLGGRFMVDDPEGFLQALHDGFGIDSRADGTRIVLTAAKPSALGAN